jgi:hypothetical protein
MHSRLSGAKLCRSLFAEVRRYALLDLTRQALGRKDLGHQGRAGARKDDQPPVSPRSWVKSAAMVSQSRGILQLHSSLISLGKETRASGYFPIVFHRCSYSGCTRWAIMGKIPDSDESHLTGSPWRFRCTVIALKMDARKKWHISSSSRHWQKLLGCDTSLRTGLQFWQGNMSRQDGRTLCCAICTLFWTKRYVAHTLPLA